MADDKGINFVYTNKRKYSTSTLLILHTLKSTFLTYNNNYSQVAHGALLVAYSLFAKLY